jgi:hypothetical protein
MSLLQVLGVVALWTASAALVVGLVVWLISRARSDRYIDTVYLSSLASQWKAPMHGRAFNHCHRVLTVVDDGRWDGHGWRDGVLCHYADDHGVIREQFFTPAQWEAIEPGRKS